MFEMQISYLNLCNEKLLSIVALRMQAKLVDAANGGKNGIKYLPKTADYFSLGCFVSML